MVMEVRLFSKFTFLLCPEFTLKTGSIDRLKVCHTVGVIKQLRCMCVNLVVLHNNSFQHCHNNKWVDVAAKHALQKQFVMHIILKHGSLVQCRAVL